MFPHAEVNLTSEKPCIFCKVEVTLRSDSRHKIKEWDSLLQKFIKFWSRFIKVDISPEIRAVLNTKTPVICNDCCEISSKFCHLYNEWTRIELQMEWMLHRFVNNIPHPQNQTDLQDQRDWQLADLITKKSLTHLEKCPPRVKLERIQFNPDVPPLVKREVSYDCNYYDDNDQDDYNMEDDSTPDLTNSNFSENDHSNSNHEDNHQSTESFPEVKDIVKIEVEHKSEATVCRVSLRNPITPKKPRKKIYSKNCKPKCDICGQSFKVKEKFRIHQASVHNKCSKCPEISSSRADLREHQVTAHGRELDIFQCADCKKCYTRTDHLKHHQESHQSKDFGLSFKCDQCDTICTTGGSLKTHIYRMHGTYKRKKSSKKYGKHLGKAARFTCDICENEFNHASSYAHHLARMHDKCSVTDCDYRADNLYKLREHQLSVHGKEVNVFKCPECNKHFTRKDQMLTHHDIHNEKMNTLNSRFDCKICGKVCNMAYSFKLHRIQKHSQCSVKNCEFTGKNHKELRDHQVNSHGKEIDAFECPECGLVLAGRLQLLKVHRLIHEDLELVCDDCGDVFNSEDKLSTHLATVHGKGKFGCEICGKSFNLASGYHRHQAHLHNKCKVRDCKLIAESRGDLRNHEVSVHGREIHVFKCPECEMLFTRRYDLKEHQDKDHE